MEERNILDHFPGDEPEPRIKWTLILWGLALGLPAGLIHYFFYYILPPAIGFGLLKTIVLCCNEAIFLIMILSYLSKPLALQTARRQYTLGAGFVLSSVLMMPVFMRLHSKWVSNRVEDLEELLFALELSLNFGEQGILYVLAGLAIGSGLLVFLVYRYGRSFTKLASKSRPG